MQEPLDFVLAGDVAHHVRARHIGRDESVGPHDRTVHVGFGGKVHNMGMTGKRSRDVVTATDIAFDEVEPGATFELGEVGPITCVGKRVEDRDLGVGVRHDVADVIRSNETGCTGDEEFHSGACL